MADSTEPIVEEKKKRHPLVVAQLTAMGKTNPEEDEYDENELYDNINKKFGEHDTFKSEYEKAQQDFKAMWESDPLFQAVMTEMAKGGSFLEALSLHVAPEDLIPAEGEPDYEKFAKNKETRLAKLKEKQDYEAGINSNKEALNQTIDEFFAENEITDEAQKEKIISELDAFINNALQFKLDKNGLNLFYKGLTKDADIAAATEAAQAAGRLEQLTTKKTSKSDGLPGGESSGQSPERKKMSYMEYLNNKE